MAGRAGIGPTPLGEYTREVSTRVMAMAPKGRAVLQTAFPAGPGEKRSAAKGVVCVASFMRSTRPVL